MGVVKLQDKYQCDECGKIFDKKPDREIILGAGGTNDCQHTVKIMVLSQISYGFSYNDCIICDKCKVKFMGRCIKEIKEKGKIDGDKK